MDEADLCELTWEDFQDIWPAEKKQAAEHYVRCVYTVPRTNPSGVHVYVNAKKTDYEDTR